jgi:hypothetical protein
VFGKYAQITNNPENDGCINAVLRTSFRFVHPSKSSSYFLFHSRMIYSLLVSSHDLVLLDFLVLTHARSKYIQAFLTWKIYPLLYSLYCPLQLNARGSTGIFQLLFSLRRPHARALMATQMIFSRCYHPSRISNNQYTLGVTDDRFFFTVKGLQKNSLNILLSLHCRCRDKYIYHLKVTTTKDTS